MGEGPEWRADPSTGGYDRIRARIVDAAGRAVERHTLGKVRIDDIAREAGCSRATIYRYFDDKDEVIRAVLVRRARAISARLARSIRALDDPAELLVQGIVRGVEEFRSDPFFESFYGPASAPATTRVAGGSDAIHAVVREVMQPVFDMAERAGMLRSDTTRDEATGWVILVSTALLTIPLPDGKGRREQESYLRKFLVPALLHTG